MYVALKFSTLSISQMKNRLCGILLQVYNSACNMEMPNAC